jgi:uncharacterized surface protein with fasciclin (FAS1) repeats
MRLMNSTRWLGRVTLAVIAATATACGQQDDPAVGAMGGTASEMPAAVAAPERDLVQVAVGAGNFTTLVRAVEAAGLVEVLQGPGPFTVFAPTDEAFARLPEGTLESLLQDREALATVLTYHVVPGRITSAEVLSAGSAAPTTVQGESLTVTGRDGRVEVDGATVVQADVMASNGVIHAIDSVVLPDAAR